MTKRQELKEEVARHLAKNQALDLDDFDAVKMAIEEFAQPGINDRLDEYISEIVEKPQSWKKFINGAALQARLRVRETREILAGAVHSSGILPINLARLSDIEILQWERRGGRFGAVVSDFDTPKEIEGVIYVRYTLRHEDKNFVRMATFHVTDWGWTKWEIQLAGDMLLERVGN